MLVYVPAGTRARRADPGDRVRRPRCRRSSGARSSCSARAPRPRSGSAMSPRARDFSTVSSSSSSATARTCATSASRRSRTRAGSSRPSALRSAATPTSIGSRSASAPRAARCGWRPSSPGAARARGLPAPTPATVSQHLDYDTTQEHAAEDTNSDLAFRGVLADQATAVWRGMIRVDPGCAANGRVSGEPKPAAVDRSARRCDSRARDRGR